jgi:hypothetical protein
MESLYSQICLAETINREGRWASNDLSVKQIRNLLRIKQVLIEEKLWEEAKGIRQGAHLDALLRELRSVRSVFRKYQKTNGRDAVYEYLEAVFALVFKWYRDGSELWHARWCLRLKGRDVPKTLDPFVAVISCTVGYCKIHRLTVSKWARALSYAVKHKPPDLSLPNFVQGLGGINRAAAKASRLRRGRRRPD